MPGHYTEGAAALLTLPSDPAVVREMLGDGKATVLFEKAYRDVVSLPSAQTAYHAFFEAIARDYLERLPKSKAGERRGIDVNGDLLVSLPTGRAPPERSSLVNALASARWYDPQARGPKFG